MFFPLLIEPCEFYFGNVNDMLQISGNGAGASFPIKF